MALGNERPRDDSAKSKSRSLTALGQSLRRGLTTRRSAKTAEPALDAQPESDSTANSRTNDRPHASLPSNSSNILHASYAKTSGYTPSPLSRGGVASGSTSGINSSGAGGGSSGNGGLATGSTAQIGLGTSDSSGIYGNIRTQRVSSASNAHPGSSSASGASAALTGASGSGPYRKTIYGGVGLNGMVKSGLNNSSPSLVASHAGSAPGVHSALAIVNESSPLVVRKGPPPASSGGGGPAVANRDYSFAIAANATSATVNAQSARSSNGASVTPTKEGYLSKKTDINPSTSLASALSRGWKVYRVVLKGAKIFFYKPPSESEMRAMFPEEIAAATNETAGGYFRTSRSIVMHEDSYNTGSGFPMGPGEVEAGSRSILFEAGVHDGEITAPLCERFVFGECFTEVDLRSLKFKRYVCALIFDDTIVVLKRRWVRQGLASSFFGAVSNKMRFGKGARAKTTQVPDNSSLVSAELGIQGKGYFTKWKFHSQYPLANVEAIEAASSRFSVSHAPGMLGHLGRESQAGSGRISLYSIGNSSVSSIMTRTSTVSKDYSGALSSGLIPGFQIFVGGKERVARMFVATTSDAKNNWLSRYAAAKASYARKLRQRPRENTGPGRRYNPAGDTARRPTASGGKDASADISNCDDKLKSTKDTRARLYWGTQRHPELVVAPRDALETVDDIDSVKDVVVIGGSKSALVHEMMFGTTQPARCTDEPSSDGNHTVSFGRQLVGTYLMLMDTVEFLREFQRYADLVLPEMDEYEKVVSNLCEVVLALASLYATTYEAEEIGILRMIVTKAIAAAGDKGADSALAEALGAVDRMVPVAEPAFAGEAVTANPTTEDSVPDSPPDMPRLMSYELVGVPAVQVENGGKPSSSSSTLGPLRVRSKTHHGDAEPAVPQIPTVPELIRVEITGLSPSLLLRISPSEFAHQLYLFHKQQLSSFNPKQARLYIPMPDKHQPASSAVLPTPSLLTVGAAPASDAEHSPALHLLGSSAAPGSTSAGESGSREISHERMLDMQRQLMAFTQNEPHFITRMVHHQLLVELPLNRPARRSALLQHWVRIGEECRVIGDAVSWAAIAMAVTMAPIARLRETWHGVALMWKDLIVSEWVPLLIHHGIHDADIGASGAAAELRPLVIRPQLRGSNATVSSSVGYTYTPIPYYGTIRMCVNRQGRRVKHMYEPTIAGVNGGDIGDKVLFAHLGYMYGAVQAAIDSIPNIVVERARTSIMRSRASSVSLTSKFQQQQQKQNRQKQQAGAVSGNSTEHVRRDSVQSGITQGSAPVDPALQGHQYLQAYLRTLAINPLKIGDELVESDMAEYDMRFLLSLSLQCEPSVADQYQQHLLSDASDTADDMAAAPSALRQAPGSILPLVCPETVPSTNILQWITPAPRTPVSAAHMVGRASNVSGRAGTFSHAAPNIQTNAAMGTDEAGPTDPLQLQQQNQRVFGELGDMPAVSGNDSIGLRHKRSRSFPNNVPAGLHAAGGGAGGSDQAGGKDVSAINSTGRMDQQISDAAHGEANYAGATIYAGNGDLALRVLRVQYTQATSASQALRFVAEVQGGTLPLLLDLLINGIEHHSAGITNSKGARIQLPGGTAPVLLFNRDVFQRTLMASFRHFCVGLDVVDSMRRALEVVDAARSWTAAESVFGALLDVCENWLGQHISDFFDSTALRESMADFLQSLVGAIGRAKPEDKPHAGWPELHARAVMLLPDLVAQLLTPSGYTPLEKLLDKRLNYAINRERRSSTASPFELTLQSPLSMLSVADPDVLLVSLNRLAQTHFAMCSFNDWLVAFCLLEMQTHAPLPWYPKKRVSHVPAEDDLVVSDIYQVLEQTHRTRAAAQSLDLPGAGTGAGAGVGVGVAATTAETSLVRTMPQSIQTMLELHRFVRGWVIRQIADPACSLTQRVARIQKFLTVIRLCRKDSQLSSSRVFGGLLNSYMREAGMIPDRQPSYRANSIKGYSSVAGGSRVTGEAGRRGRRKGGQSQIKYVPSFVERAVASALVSPESRQFVRAWNEVAAENNTKLETLEGVLRGARDWSAFDSAPSTPTMPSESSLGSFSKSPSAEAEDATRPKGVPVQRSRSNPITDDIDITEDTMARADCFVPCLGWLLENMVSLCYDTPDTLVDDSRLINLAKRHRVFIMLCVCDQLASRCQEAFALPTKIRIDLSQLSAWVAQTPLQTADIRIASQNESAIVDINESMPVGGAAQSGAVISSVSLVPAGGNPAGLSIAGDRGFSFSSPPTHSGGFSRPVDIMPPMRSNGQGGFAKRSIANLRSASGGSGGPAAGVIPGVDAAGNTHSYYSRKSTVSTPHATPEFAGAQAFGSPPAPVPRSLVFADGPISSGGAGLALVVGTSGSGAQNGGVVVYLRPFTRLVTDEVEKMRQEIRERERLERELRDREQAFERQKNERTKILKRQLKEQQQRRAKNEPLLKMANLMNKVGISARESSIDGVGSLPKGISSYSAPTQASRADTVVGAARDSRLSESSVTSGTRPRGPALPNAKPANVINLINSTITVEQGYTKRDFVFRIVTEEGGQYLLQAPDCEQMEDWIAAMRDAATEAAARRLTLFVEEAKKRSNSDAPGAGMSMFMGMGDPESQSQYNQGQGQGQQQQNQQRAMGASDTTRSRFTAFLGGSTSAFGGFGLSSQTPSMPNRTMLTNMQQQQQLQASKEAAANSDPKSFGIDLAKLMPDPKVVPVIVEKCLTEIELRGLEEVGIYRVSGAAADVSRLRSLFNSDPEAVDLSLEEFYDINVVSGVIKQFLRELPEPLMTYNLYEGFINAASIDDYDERLWAIKDLVHALPTTNYTVLKRCVEHLERVTDYEEVNHMYGTNLALVFGPSLLRPPPGSSSFALAMSNLGHAQSVIKNLILQYHWLFNVEEEAEPIEDGEMTVDSTPEMQAASVAADLVEELEAGIPQKRASNNLSVTRAVDSAVVHDSGDQKARPPNISIPNQRDSVALMPLSPATQADMDQLAMAVNNMSV